MKELRQPIHKRMHELRKALNKTQPEFAKIIGVTTSAISLMETGNREYKLSYIIKICDYFEIELKYLFDSKIKGEDLIKTNY